MARATLQAGDRLAEGDLSALVFDRDVYPAPAMGIGAGWMRSVSGMRGWRATFTPDDPEFLGRVVLEPEGTVTLLDGGSPARAGLSVGQSSIALTGNGPPPSWAG